MKTKKKNILDTLDTRLHNIALFMCKIKIFKRMSAHYLFSLWLTRNIDKTHLLCRIIFIMFLSNLKVKSFKKR